MDRLFHALLVVDMQNDFVKGGMSTPQAREIVGNVKAKIEQYRSSGGSVLFTLDTHLDSDYEEEKPTAEAAALPRHCIKGTQGWQVIDELAPYLGENVLEKPTFLGLGLEERLGMPEDSPRNTIELCGVCTDICVVSNALYLRARYPKTKIVVDSACCAGVTPEAHQAALTVMKNCLIAVK